MTEEYAFPDNLTQDGLSKREWFAGMALMGIAYAYAEVKGEINALTPPVDFEKNLANGAFAIADAMIAESKKCVS